MAPFRFQGINVALTYPTCTLLKEDIYNHLLSLSIDRNTVQELLVAQETHEDGQPHFHCYLRWSSKPNIRNPNFFDILGFHPNIQTCRSRNQWIQYCTKTDKEPKSNFEWDKSSNIQRALQQIRKSNEENLPINYIVDQALNLDPGLLRSYSQVRSYIADRRSCTTLSLPLFDLTSFSLTAADDGRMRGYAEAFRLHTPGNRLNMHSLWFVGPSRMGKTALARSIGEHWYIGGTWNMDKLNDDAKYGVLDDIPWEDLSWKDNYKKLLGLQTDFTLTDKYRHKKQFKLGMPVIVCTNDIPPFTAEQRAWLTVNVKFWSINNPIYPDNPRYPFEIINI